MTRAAATNGRRASSRLEPVEVEREIDAFADRDRDREDGLVVVDAPPAPDLRWRAPDLAAEIDRLSSMPWIDLRLGESVIARARLAMLVALMAPSGVGKSSAAIAMAADHARRLGPAVYISAEMDADMVAARPVGQALGVSWEGVLSLTEVGASDVERELAKLHRLIILDGERATLVHAEQAIGTLRAEHPSEPVLVVVDYVQIMPGEGREERVRVASIVESIRRWTQRLAVVTLMISQTSRAAAKGMRDGEIVGADTTTTGAESSQIERAASVTLAIGGLRAREDGRSDADLSLGKSRTGGGDKVYPAIYCGRTGNWSIVGPPVSGAEKRAEQATAKVDNKRERAGLAVLGFLGAADRPQTRQEIQIGASLTNNERGPVVAALMASGKVVSVMTGLRKGGFWPLWTPDKAKAAGMRTEVES